MTRLSHTCLAALVTLLLQAAPALAQYEKGVSALQAGDYAAALAAWQAGAEANEAKSQYSLGYLAQFGLGVPADAAKAKEWYEKAAAQNDPDALYALGLLYESGKAGRKDLAEAMTYYRKAAESGGQRDAEYAVGRMILRGRGVPRDPVEGIKWLRKAAEHDQPAAQYMLGAAYEAGWGVAPDKAEAYYWYGRSMQGDPVELEEQDMAFQPKIAIASLKRQLPAEEIARIEARLKKTASATPPQKSGAKPAPHGTDPSPAPRPAAKAPSGDGLPDALTKPR